ncbi:MAG TPA: TetR/AcrR family transcriptional regulator [Bacteroidales bacterium]|jgi:AcrR family transcriptional regulator|nr:TetR/AcrR family transcriptional regulator [Bacteroidales bacterium]
MTNNDKQTEEKIFEAAEKVFEEQGLTGARMQNIADRAGINKALLHYYFRTKEHLFEAVFTKLASRVFSKFTPIFDENLSIEDKIRFFFREHIEFLRKNPRLPGFILNEINHNPERIKKLISYIDIKDLWKTVLDQHKHELHRYNITEENLPQLLTSIVSLSVFPFAARGIFETVFDKLGYDFDSYLEERKEYAAELVIRSIRKNE